MCYYLRPPCGNYMFGSSARPNNCEGGGIKARAHLKIKLTSRRFNTACWKGICHEPSRLTQRFRQNLGECIYQIRPHKLVDVVPGNISMHSGIYFPEKK